MKGILALLLFVALVSSSLVPTHVVITLTANLSNLQVTFTTSTKPTTPSVSYWTSANPTKQVEIVASPSDIHTFTHPTTGTIDYITSVTLKELEPDTIYGYCANGLAKDNSTQSHVYTFTSLPKDTDTLRIGIYGDLGAYGTGLTEKGMGGLLYWAKNRLFDFIIHNGDLAYNLDSNSGKTGEEFLENLENVSATIPYMVTPGNHEFMGDSETYYKNWFVGQSSLGTSSGSGDPTMFYSFDVGSKLHIVVMSTEVYCEDHDNIVPQYEWLEKDLTAVRARSVQPWVLVFGHRQIYIGSTSTLHSRLMRLGLQCNDSTLQHCDYTKSCDSKKDCGYSIEQLFAKYKVDMYFAGHVHTYNRMFPISDDLTYEAQDVNSYSNPQHPVYVVSGAAGTQSSPSEEIQDADPLASPTAAAVTGYTFSLVSVYNDTHLRLEQNDITTNKIVDTFWIVKDHSHPPWSKTTALTIDSDDQIICDQ